jgi:hypothetical protein
MPSNIADTLTVSALTSSGTITGNVSGNLTGNGAGTWTGPVVGNLTGNVTGFVSGVAYTQQVITTNSAITLLSGHVTITQGSASAITLAAPTAGTDDGKVLIIFSETAFAHQITCPVGFNRKGSSGTATASAAANNTLHLIARNGQWNVLYNLNFTLA